MPLKIIATIATQTLQEKPRLHFLDGLRGWGAILVLLFHTFVEIYPISPDAGRLMAHIFLFSGGLAIFVFFIVSGFALSSGFLRSGDRRLLERILAGRYVRLAVPILFGCLIVYLFSKSGLLLEPLRRDSASDLSDVLAFAVFGVFSASQPYINTPIPQLWTMPFEALGSIMILGLLWLIGTWRARFLIYAVLIIYFCSRPMFAAFLVGVLLAEAHQLEILPLTRQRISFVATTLLVPSLLLVAVLPGRSELVLLGVSTLVAVCVVFSEPAKAFFSNRFSSFLGEISFPLYILHGAVIFSFGTWLQRSADGPGAVLIANLLTVVAAVSFAWLFRWIDTAGIIAAHQASKAMLGFRRPKRSIAL